MKIASFVISVTAMCISIAALILALVRQSAPGEKKTAEELNDDAAPLCDESEEPEEVGTAAEEE